MDGSSCAGPTPLTQAEASSPASLATQEPSPEKSRRTASRQAAKLSSTVSTSAHVQSAQAARHEPPYSQPLASLANEKDENHDNDTVVDPMDDDDQSSSSSEESASSTSTADGAVGIARATPLTLAERRARNVQRNMDVLNSLGIAHGMVRKSQPNKRRKRSAAAAALPDSAPRGMLLVDGPTPTARHFPHRLAEFRKLSSLCGTAHGTPILVTGPSGSGKTAVVQAVLASNCQPYAYADCTTIDCIEELVYACYTQLERQIHLPHHIKKTAAGERLKQLFGQELGTKLRRQKHTVELATTTTAVTQSVTAGAEAAATWENGMATSKRRLSARNTTKRAAHVARVQKVAQQAKHDDIDGAVPPQSATNTAPTAVWIFGRALQSLLLASCDYVDNTSSGIKSRISSSSNAAVVVVDHAERLATMGSSKGSSDRVNFLAQLLLLPRTLALNLTIVVITKSVLLEHTALNNVSSQGTIAAHIDPFRVHFAAYRGRNVIKAILSTSRLKRMIVGEPCEQSTFHSTVFQSFLDTLVQSLHDLTTDIKEFIRLGRALWPKYIAPVGPPNIEKTLQSIRKASASRGNADNAASVQREVLTLLDQRIYPHVRHALEHGLGALAFDSPGVVLENASKGKAWAHETPFLANYLLLAAYVCQSNRPDKDLQLFSIQKNGRKRRNAKEDTGEDVAFGSGPQDQLKTLRPRAFPLERLYSLYVSMVSLNASNELAHGGESAQDDALLSLGNTAFHETVEYLKNIGILHDCPKRTVSESIRISQRSFWSSITREEAEEVAQNVKFPLDRYIL